MVIVTTAQLGGKAAIVMNQGTLHLKPLSAKKHRQKLGKDWGCCLGHGGEDTRGGEEKVLWHGKVTSEMGLKGWKGALGVSWVNKEGADGAPTRTAEDGRFSEKSLRGGCKYA